MCYYRLSSYLYCEQNTARAKFRSSGEKSSNLQSNECSISTSTSENPTNQNDNNLKQPNNETLDLADLDLSQLRLTKKDLEALSSITPSLPKHFQDQLLAQLPPNQARKLSRTLSMQASTRTPNIYKRSLSTGRDGGIENTEPSASKSPNLEKQNVDLTFDASDTKFNGMDSKLIENEPSSLLSFDRNSVLRRSMSRGRDPTVHRRSTSALRNEYPSRMSYTGDLRADYKPNDSAANRYCLTDYTSGLASSALRPEYYSKLPLPTSSSISPQKSPSNETLESPFRRRHSSRGYSRFSRPDFYGSTSSINAGDDNNALLKVRGEKERETQSVLREIRERSRDRSRTIPSKNESHSRDGENLSNGDACTTHKDHRRKSSIPNIRITVDKQNGRIYHARNKSMERCCDIDDTEKIDDKESGHIRRASMTNARSITARPPNPVSETRSKPSAAEFTDDILSELVRRSKEYTENGDFLQKTEKKDDCGTVKKTKIKPKDGKKTKTKPKGTETCDQNTKVTQNGNNEPMNEVQSVTLPLPKSSKIARRMSVPNKDENVNDKANDQKSEAMEKKSETSEKNVNVMKETKIYTNSKLTPPKEVSLKIKKSSNSNAASTSRNAITAVMEKFMEKSAERLSPGKSTITATKIKSDSGEKSAPKTKKKIKVVKKLAKTEQSPTKETSPKSNETSKETSPVKERKSPEKKLKTGFLYSIGQKFEKMRENSKNKEKEKKITKTIDIPIVAASEIDVKLPMHCEMELPKDVETVQTIIIPRRVKDDHGEIVQNEEITIRQIDLPPSISANSIGKGEQRKSRIDAVIRNLRERSVPHTVRSDIRESELATESGLLKRAVSVEDMTNGAVNFNKQGNVNKVLGLFKRIEKEQQLQKQQYLDANEANGESTSKERPKSGGFVSKMKKSSRPYYTGAKSDTIITLTDQFERQYLCERADQLKAENATASNTKIPYLRASFTSKADAHPIQLNNFDSMANGTRENTSNNVIDEKLRDDKRETLKPQIPIVDVTNNALSEKERIRNNRKGLVLDLSNEQYNDHFKKISNDSSNNNNSYQSNSSKSFGGQCNGSNENHVNNNFAGNGNYYPQFYSHSDRNHEPYTPTCELATSYSSDARSIRDDCESTSTFLSPTDEHELCFDDWSACSGSTDDHMPLHPKHLKYASMRIQSEQNHNQVPSTSIDPAPSTPSDSESVIDRIKRRSYYCRFNEKKPKRTSSIVGPNAQREYYREMANKTKSRASDYSPLTPNGYQTESDGSFSRGGSKSPTPMNIPTSMNFKDSSSRANTPSCYSTADESEKFKPPQYHYHFHQRSQTPSRSVKSPFEPNDIPKNKSSEYLNLRSTLTSPPASISVSKYYSNPVGTTTSLPSSDYHHNGNRSYSMRNSAYDSLTTPIVYGTYNPKRRMSTSYLAPSIVAANSTNGYLSTPKDHLSTSCYATLRRSKPKAYDRSVAMLDTGAPTSLLTKRIGTINSTSDNPYAHSYYRPAHDYSGHFNSRSSLRSPTIIQSSSSNV